MKFDEQTIAFLEDLARHNDRDWFQSQKGRYEAHVKAPTKAFVSAMTPLLARRFGAPVTAKVFRINRDLRFSRDQAPYNTHIHIGFTDSATGAAWMVGLETDRLVLGFGGFGFDATALERWRAAVAGPAGARLARALARLQADGCRIDEPELKRVPAPWPQDHPNAGLLRRKSMTVWIDSPNPSDAFGEQAPTRIVAELARLRPVRSWWAEQL
ncbi:MAG: DUF2461 domain-containing protein [Burkholderiaceae bacterium]